MNISEIVMFPTQLVHVETTKFSAEKKSDEVKTQFSITAETRGEIIDDKNGKSYIKIRVENDDFYLEEEKVGHFQFSELIDDEKKAIQFMEVQGIRILWSYIVERRIATCLNDKLKCYIFQDITTGLFPNDRNEAEIRQTVVSLSNLWIIQRLDKAMTEIMTFEN